MTPKEPLSNGVDLTEVRSCDSCRDGFTNRLETENPLILQSQRRKLKELGVALRKWLRQPLALPSRNPRDPRKRDRSSNRRMIGRLYFGWFGGVQLFYSRESEP